MAFFVLAPGFIFQVGFSFTAIVFVSMQNLTATPAVSSWSPRQLSKSILVRSHAMKTSK